MACCLWQALSDLAGYASRLSEFLTALEDDVPPAHGASRGRPQTQEDGSKREATSSMACFQPRSGTVLSRGAASRGGMRQRVTTDGPLTGPQASRSKLGGAMDGGQQEKGASRPSNGGERGPVLLSVEGLTLRLSDGRWLFHDVCFQVR